MRRHAVLRPVIDKGTPETWEEIGAQHASRKAVTSVWLAFQSSAELNLGVKCHLVSILGTCCVLGLHWDIACS